MVDDARMEGEERRLGGVLLLSRRSKRCGGRNGQQIEKRKGFSPV
jgi:hypothetical protein